MRFIRFFVLAFIAGFTNNGISFSSTTVTTPGVTVSTPTVIPASITPVTTPATTTPTAITSTNAAGHGMWSMNGRANAALAPAAPCGQGGVTCPTGTICVLNDNSGQYFYGPYMSGGTICKVPMIRCSYSMTACQYHQTTVPLNGAATGITTSVTMKTPYAAVFDSSGNMFVADQGSNAIQRIDAGTGVITTIATNITAPTLLAIDGSNTLYTVDSLNHVIKIMPTSVSSSTQTIIAGNDLATSSVASQYALGAVFNAGFSTTTQGTSNITGLTVDSAGHNIYLSDAGNQQVKIVTYTPSATVNTGTYTVSTIATQISAPQGLALDATGNLYTPIRDYN